MRKPRPRHVHADPAAQAELRAHLRPLTAMDPARLAAAQKRWEQGLKMPPKQAAATVVCGLERGSARILLGNDARPLDALARLSPAEGGQTRADAGGCGWMRADQVGEGVIAQ